jgi:hypothetical protein
MDSKFLIEDIDNLPPVPERYNDDLYWSIFFFIIKEWFLLSLYQRIIVIACVGRSFFTGIK